MAPLVIRNKKIRIEVDSNKEGFSAIIGNYGSKIKFNRDDMPAMKRLGFPLALSLLLSCSQQPLPLTEGTSHLKVPQGFRIALFADHVPRARTMALGPDGTIYVGSQDEGVVYAVKDQDGDGVAESQRVLLKGLDEPNGVAVVDDGLFVAEIARVTRFGPLGQPGFEKNPATMVYQDLPHETHHAYKIIKKGPDGSLYLAIGVPCNVCEPEDPRYGTIIKLHPDGTQPQRLAKGIRNSMGIDWDPETKDLWFTDNGRDGLGDDIPPDELNHLNHVGLDYGFPHCFGKEVLDPDLGQTNDCQQSTPPAFEFKAHVAPLGLHFYQGERFPKGYNHQLFIAQHGSWNRTQPSGYQVTTVTFDGNRNPVSEMPLVTGWLGPHGEIYGRPVDFLELSDGSLLISDDKAGVIYRLSAE